MPDKDLRQTPERLIDTFRQFSNLMQSEVALAKCEVGAGLRRARAGLGLLAGAAILALVGLNVLAAALVAALAETGISAGTASGIVGGGLLAVGLALALAGRAKLSKSTLKPSATASNLRRDVETARRRSHA